MHDRKEGDSAESAILESTLSFSRTHVRSLISGHICLRALLNRALNPTKMTELPVFVVDAFTKHPFGGNQAAVCILEGTDWPVNDVMQKVAKEMNMAETAFCLKDPGEEGRTFSITTLFKPHFSENHVLSVLYGESGVIFKRASL